MTITYFDTTAAMTKAASEAVLDTVNRIPDALLCAATGSSPKDLYAALVEYRAQFESVRVMALDEWIGLPSSEGSCHAYIEEHILNPLQISQDRYFGFNARAKNLDHECDRVQAVVRREGPIDVCILGLGKNGHLGFNEPAEVLQPHCHIADLTRESQQHSMVRHTANRPAKGLTLGMHDILSAKKIILLVSGEGKEAVLTRLLEGNTTNACPATWLWQHHNADCLILK